MAFVDVFDMKFSLKHEIEYILGIPIVLNMFIYILCLFYIITKGATTT